jgi:hypothetical protein
VCKHTKTYVGSARGVGQRLVAYRVQPTIARWTRGYITFTSSGAMAKREAGLGPAEAGRQHATSVTGDTAEVEAMRQTPTFSTTRPADRQMVPVCKQRRHSDASGRTHASIFTLELHLPLEPEVGRMQARESTREFTACDKQYGEIHGSGRVREKQKQGGASNVRATQGDADGSRHAL